MKLVKLEKYNCRNCDMLSAMLDSTEVEYETINVEDTPESAAKYGVMSVPVLLLVNNSGEVEKRLDGYSPQKAPLVHEMINKM